MFKGKIHFFKFTIVSIVLAILSSLVVSNTWVKQSSNNTFDSIKEIPKNKVGLLLGTSKYIRKGIFNKYYAFRIKAACELFKAKKIEYILVSGDNGIIEYNEPFTMKKDLIAAGIPANRIILDFAGFRTLDSIVRAFKVFGQPRFTIISQAFHNERAIFIARHENLDAIGFNAKDVSWKEGLKTNCRELLARVKVVLDIYIIDKQPKFLGKKIEIPN